MGAPAFAAPTLLEIIGQGHDVIAAYTRAPRPAGRRGLEITKTPVHLVAEQHAIPVFTPVSLRNDAEQEQLRALQNKLVAIRKLIEDTAEIAAQTSIDPIELRREVFAHLGLNEAW